MSARLLPGTVVGGEYVVMRPLEEGGMGAVYVATQQSTGKLRALKVMHREIVAEPGLQRRFEQEAKVGARIKSEHVVEVLAAGVDGGMPWLVMELLEGEDLRHRLDARGPLPLEDVRVLFEQLCHAMAAAHAGGVVHRDLKPENIFLSETRRAGSETLEVKVLDFGIAKLAAEAGTRATSGAVGSPMWMAPEQTTPGPVTAAADVWALGLLAYEVLIGQNFWRAANEIGGTPTQLLREIVLDPIPLASERAGVAAHRLPVGFDAWFARCLAREASVRFGDAGEMWASMRPLFGRAPTDPLAATFAAPARLDDTAPPTNVMASMPAQALSEPPVRSMSGETPVASTHDRTAPPSRRYRDNPAKSALIVGISIAVAGIAVGWGLSQRQAPSVVGPPVAAPSAGPVDKPKEEPPPLPTASEVPVVKPIAKAASATASASGKPRGSIAGGFGDPTDRNGAVLWKVQGRQVRLFTRLASNDSNVADGTVRKAIEWNSWEYLRCYERAFGGAKEMPAGVVVVDFEILDQLPRFAKLRSSTIQSDTFNSCVVSTLVGQTINAAGPEGKGKAAEAFRFQPMD